jgi:hypothetical protein
LLLARNPRADLSYAELPLPADCSSAEVEFSFPEARVRLVRTRLVADRLEKGVIRRARICGWFLPSENDLAAAVELAKQFVDEPLPLTA